VRLARAAGAPLTHGFTWKTAFYRGALLCISNRLHEQRKVQRSDGPVTALVLRTEQENDNYIRQRFGEVQKGRGPRRGYHAGAWQRGHERGADVSLVPAPKLHASRRPALDS
jgi:hypothetical protein